MTNNTPTNGNDTLVGSSGNDSIDALAGNDYVLGLQGDDLLIGNSGDDALDGQTGIDTMAGGAGNDTYVVDFAIETGPGIAGMIAGIGDIIQELSSATHGTADRLLTYVSYNMLLDDFDNNGVGDGIDVENARIVSTHTWSDPLNGAFTGQFIVGTGITLTGNALDNTLEGDFGANNTLIGGAGNDTYVVHTLPNDPKAESITEVTGGGNDTIMYTPLVAGQTYALPDSAGANNQIENLTFGGTLAINGVGNALDNTLTGNGGTNSLTGLTGNDTYVIQSLLDKPIETVGSGTANGIDTVSCSISYSLALLPDIENITLTGTTSVTATGNGAVNILAGNDGSNIMNGVSSPGNVGDTYLGSLGNDTYMVHSTTDYVLNDPNTLHTPDGGTDLIIATLAGGQTYDMTATAAHVDNLTLAGTANVNVNANTENNVITGNAGVNTIFGGGGTDTLMGMGGSDTLYAGTGNARVDGGAGVDVMYNGNGNDTFIVDNSSDLIQRGYTLPGTVGADVILSSVTFNMLTQADDFTGERALTLVGSLAINAWGNNLSDTINGNIGSNVIVGGAGADTINGNGGLDHLYGGAGDDTVIGGANIDIIYGDDSLGSQTGNDSLNGGGANDTLYGGQGNDILDGGIGPDLLVGGAGNDLYRLVSDVQDTIIDLGTGGGTDTIEAHFSFQLPDTSHGTYIEDLVLAAGTIGTGNELDNEIDGNTSNNTLSGLAGNDTINGGGGNDKMDGGTGADTMTGDIGSDTFIVDNAGDVVTGGGGIGRDIVFSSVDFDLSAYAGVQTVHDLTLTGNTAVTATGNALDNIITGNGIVNTLIGLGGGDTYVMDNNSDTIVEAASGGNDTVMASVSFNLSAPLYVTQEIENITLTGTANINATGNDLDNILTGNGGTNTLDGGLGNDTYVLGPATTGNILPDVILVDTGGNDTVSVGYTYSIAARLDLENITLTGTGNFGAIGNTNVNILIGNAGANVLDAGSSGGTGDTYVGSNGNDTYMVDETTDSIIPDALGDLGIDLALSSAATYDMSVQAVKVDNLTLIGSANISGTGNNLDNIITGNTGSNTLAGGAGNDTIHDGGGAGVDTMIGNTGNDTYFVDISTDIVVENTTGPNEGIDTIFSSVNFNGSINMIGAVENLTLTGTAVVGVGNASDNTITGNAGNNVLDGQAGNDTIDGGKGDDTMTGGTGNDTFIVDSLNDSVLEAAGEGTKDLIKSSISLTLLPSTTSEVENLTLTGTANINGTGNDLVNTITGNSGINILDGSTGADTMIGGGNLDTYMVDNSLDFIQSGSGTAIASVDYNMGAEAATVNNLTLTGVAGQIGTGNALNNVITSNSTTCTVDGGSGSDTLVLFNQADVVLDNDNGSIDSDVIKIDTAHFNGATSYDMHTNATGTRALTITGAGNFDVTCSDITSAGLSPLPGGDTITGNSGINHITGGTGDDTFFVGTNDFVVDTATSSDSDTVAIAFSLSLLADEALGGAAHWKGVEDILLTGTLALNATGDTMVNTLTGNSGINLLNDGEFGAAPSAGDTMIGGAGNDTYFVNNSNDICDEVHNNAGGTDWVYYSVSYSLGQGVDNAQLFTNASGDYVVGGPGVTLIGNALTNTLDGTNGNDTIDGGLGADVMNGGLGDDTYFVDSTDTIIDAGGVDTVVSEKASYTLPTGMENLILLDGGPPIIKVGIGNTVNNIITGNSLDDTLDGKTGADTMYGGDGNDTFYVDNIHDAVFENPDTSTLPGAGLQDLIISTMSATLDHTTPGGSAGSFVVTPPATLAEFGFGQQVENLTLTGTAVWGVGNSLDNSITGNGGSNTLVGGDGNDVLDGGLGKDVYVGGNGSNSFVIGSDAITNHDTIVDYTGQDVLVYNSVLIGFDPLKNVLDDFVAYRFDGTNTLAYVDRDGVTGTQYGFQEVAVILGVDLS